MALTNAQIEAHLGRFLRLLVTGLQGREAVEQLDLLMPLLLRSGARYVRDGTLGTQAERREAITTFAKGCYQAHTGANPEDGGRGEHGFLAHWLPERQQEVV